MAQDTSAFLSQVYPYDALSADAFSAVVSAMEVLTLPKGTFLFTAGDPMPGLYVIQKGAVEITDAGGSKLSLLGPPNSFGERGLLRGGGKALTTGEVVEDSILLRLPPKDFLSLMDTEDAAKRFFQRSRPVDAKRTNVNTSKVSELMTPSPLTCQPTDSIQTVAQHMRQHKISCLAVVEGEKLVGIVTGTDMVRRVVADAGDPTGPISSIMTADPFGLPSTALGSDVLHVMVEHGFGHLPIVDGDRLVGIVTQTDITRFQAVSAAALVQDIAKAHSAEDMVAATARIPSLLVQLVAAGNRHEVVTRLITDIADACTRRLLTLAEEKLGPAPVPWLWLACGSQGRQEQTGVSDQDNCLILSDEVTDDQMAYFQDMATFVTDGLNTCGYVYCPGDMMATNPKWCQPLRVWRQYFQGWIDKPDPMAQMLSSVMYDLRPIGGDDSLFTGLQAETLKKSAANSIYMAHMLSNALKHTPPLGLLRGLATIRSGEHKNQLDLKHNGVVPIVDLGRLYALQGQLMPVNTRARLEAAREAGTVSSSGGADLLAAYDMIADERLSHQAHLIKTGEKPSNFLPPSELSDFQRSHLRDAFVVVRSMQSALAHGRAAPV